MFLKGKDDIIFGADLYKFHPGISSNFVQRYVQISRKAFRYFKNKFHLAGGKPLVAFRKKIILKAVPYRIENKSSYLKPGAKITKTHKEDVLFDNMFEIILNEDYEDNYLFRDIEKADLEARNRAEFNTMTNRKSKKRPKRNNLTAKKDINTFEGSNDILEVSSLERLDAIRKRNNFSVNNQTIVLDRN